MYGEETAGRQYVKKNITQREPEYDKNTDRHKRKSTQVKWGGRDGRREPEELVSGSDRSVLPVAGFEFPAVFFWEGRL